MTMTVGEELDSIFEYEKILEAAKKHFEAIDPNDINFMAISHWLVALVIDIVVWLHKRRKER